MQNNKRNKKKILVSCVRVIPSCLFELQQMTGVVETSFPNTRLAFFSLSFLSLAMHMSNVVMHRLLLFSPQSACTA